MAAAGKASEPSEKSERAHFEAETHTRRRAINYQVVMKNRFPLQLIACAPLYVDSYPRNRFSLDPLERGTPTQGRLLLFRYHPLLNLIR
jgi:hypothetical protein